MANNFIFQFNGFDSMAYPFMNKKKNIHALPSPPKKNYHLNTETIFLPSTKMEKNTD